MILARLRVACAGVVFCSAVSLAQTGALQFPTNTSPQPIPQSQVQGSLATGNVLDFAQYSTYFGTFLPFWEYEVQAVQTGDTYYGYILGSNPTYPWSATVSTPIVPVILTINETGYYGSTPFSWTWDPTSADVGCLGAGNTAYNLFWTSPLLTPTQFTINGQAIGTTQYADAIQRAQFYNYPGNLGRYSNRLTLEPSQYPPLVISVAAGTNAAGWYIPTPTQCGGAAPFVTTTNAGSTFGGINITYLDPLVQQYIATHGINEAQLPIFLLYKTIIFNGNATQSANCCIEGYHNDAEIGVGAHQTYVVANFEPNAYFNEIAEDVSDASHEINEWANDPFVDGFINTAPSWGGVGQFPTSCSNEFEVGDPLTGHYMTAMSSDNYPYHLQEIAFFNWFFGGTTNYGAGGLYSSNGTFTTYSTLCSEEPTARRGGSVNPPTRVERP